MRRELGSRVAWVEAGGATVAVGAPVAGGIVEPVGRGGTPPDDVGAGAEPSGGPGSTSTTLCSPSFTVKRN